MSSPIITIDGQAGSGKSSTAREVARRLGFLHLDSGALYRAFAYAACEGGWVGPRGEIAAEDVPRVAKADVGARVTEEGWEVRHADRVLGEELRSRPVTLSASRLSAFPEIRSRVNHLLRQLRADAVDGVVCEGRDMGTVVFPHADLKIFMTAALPVRARRRLLERLESTDPEAVSAEAERLEKRDRADSEREVAPLRPAADARMIDTSDLTFEEQVEKVLELVRECLDMA